MRLSSLIVLSLCPQDHTWSLTCVRLFAVPWNAAHQAPLSLGFSRQEHWSGLPFPSPMHESEKWKWSLSVVSTLSHPLACSLPGSFVHGIFQARVLEWVAIPFSRVSSWPRDWTQVSCIVGRFFTIWATMKTRVTCYAIENSWKKQNPVLKSISTSSPVSGSIVPSCA